MYYINTYSSAGYGTGSVSGKTIKSCVEQAKQRMPWLSLSVLRKAVRRAVEEK